MNDRERFLATVLGQPVDRAPFWLFWGPWRSTRQRWQQEGMPNELDQRAYFGADCPPLAVPVNTGPCPRIEPVILEEDDDYVVHYDQWGILRRDYKHGESMSQFLSFPVKNRCDWEAFRDQYLNLDDPRRLDGDWRQQAQAWMEKGYPIQLGYYPDGGVFGPYRWLMGDEEGLIALKTEPDLAHEIMDHITSLYLTVWEQVVKDVRVDVIHLWEDMCYVAGPLISPKMWQAFLGPNYRRIKAFADQHAIPVISVDTDGQPERIARPMIEAGVNLLFPMEVAAGCDVNAWRQKYPELALMGGIDKRQLAQSPQAIDRELARIRPALQHGRYIPDLDHLIPDDVSWDHFCYYAEHLKKMIYEAGEGSQ